jgi:hypothetical protein
MDRSISQVISQLHDESHDESVAEAAGGGNNLTGVKSSVDSLIGEIASLKDIVAALLTWILNRTNPLG